MDALFPNLVHQSALTGLIEAYQNGSTIEFIHENEYILIKEVNNTSYMLLYDIITGTMRDLLIYGNSSLSGAYCYSDQQTEWGYDFGREFLENINSIGDLLKGSYEDLGLSNSHNGLMDGIKDIDNLVKSIISRDIVITTLEIGSFSAGLLGYFITGTTGAILLGIPFLLMSEAEIIRGLRNKYITDKYWKYLSPMMPIWEGKVITVKNNKTGYLDFIEVPYKIDSWELDRSKAIYVDMTTGKRNMTIAETYKYF
jgi:hypothetical protein